MSQTTETRQGDLIRVSINIGSDPPIARLTSALVWLEAVDAAASRLVSDALHLTNPGVLRRLFPSPWRALSLPSPSHNMHLRVRRMRFQNPFEIVLSGAAIAGAGLFTYRLLILIRDWKSTQRLHHAEASKAEAAARQAHEAAELARLQNELVAELLQEMPPIPKQLRSYVSRSLQRRLKQHWPGISEPPGDIDIDLTDR